MLTPPQLVHRAHGSPPVDGCAVASGRCYICCGAIARGLAEDERTRFFEFLVDAIQRMPP